ncbi:MAG TPA: hypothetical protein VH186_02515 [Chloroflexia bacterium]|nr:hypothetical protein [Chloroflexia bacterium]
MNKTADEKMVTTLAKQVESFVHNENDLGYRGYLFKELREVGYYEELGLSFDRADIPLFQLYAGLATLSRDIHLYLQDHPDENASWFHEIVSEVQQTDQILYHEKAFPYPDETFFITQGQEPLPLGLARAAAEDTLNTQMLEQYLANPRIIHEWTVKPGKRLFIAFWKKFGAELKEEICKTDGIKDKYEKARGQYDVVPVLVTTIITGAISASTLWIPLLVYFALLLVKTGLSLFCESGSVIKQPGTLPA